MDFCFKMFEQRFKNKNNQKVQLVYDYQIKNTIHLTTISQLRLQQVIINLLSNATKFTRSGTITLTCKLGKKKAVFIEVSDTGVGMTEEEKNKLFTPFNVANNQNMNKYGSGIGLSIVYDILKAYGIQIHCESQLNKGTSFSFEIKQKLRKASTEGGDNLYFKPFPPIENKNKILDLSTVNSTKFLKIMASINSTTSLTAKRTYVSDFCV